MNHHLIAGSSRQARRIGTVGAVLLALAVPFFTQPAASAYPGYQVSIACSATNGGSANASWGWYRGGITGTFLASGGVFCPAISGSGTSSATGSGIQPANADSLLFGVTGYIGNCGDTNYKIISFTPGSSVSVKESVQVKSPCQYAPNQGSGTLKVDSILQS